MLFYHPEGSTQGYPERPCIDRIADGIDMMRIDTGKSVSTQPALDLKSKWRGGQGMMAAQGSSHIISQTVGRIQSIDNVLLSLSLAPCCPSYGASGRGSRKGGVKRFITYDVGGYTLPFTTCVTYLKEQR